MPRIPCRGGVSCRLVLYILAGLSHVCSVSKGLEEKTQTRNGIEWNGMELEVIDTQYWTSTMDM